MSEHGAGLAAMPQIKRFKTHEAIAYIRNRL